MIQSHPKRIVIAGASGFIGKALILKLIEKYPAIEIIALSRSKQSSLHKQVTWAQCDLFSLKSIENAIPKDIDTAYYFVHSMGATAHLDQGNFADYDLLLADNFSRAVKKTKMKHLIYLSGLIPNKKNISMHLQSRLEVESVFKSFKLPYTIFRAGLIIGKSGSSLQILLKLIKRLPFMVCPHWTQTLTSPVDLETVLVALVDAPLKTENINKIFDLASCAPISYLEMMQETSRKLGKKRFFFKVPFFTPTLSRFWVCLITGSSKELVYPLVESLNHPMVARRKFLYPTCVTSSTYFEILNQSAIESDKGHTFFRFKVKSNSVRSVQRIKLPTNKDSLWAVEAYANWLPIFLKSFIQVKNNIVTLSFYLFSEKYTLLTFSKSLSRSDPTRQLLYIKSGLLVSKENTGRLEFREVLDKRYVIIAIHDYKPSLPWFIYIFTQAKFHLIVMFYFSKFINKYQESLNIDKNKPVSLD